MYPNPGPAARTRRLSSPPAATANSPCAPFAPGRTGGHRHVRQLLLALACSLSATLQAGEPAPSQWPCAWGDLPCLLREGGTRLEQRQLEDAYLFFEQAAFIAPDDPAVRRALGETLLRLGATRAAADLLPDAGKDSGAQSQRLEMALGYSSNRNQLPELSQLRLTLPGLGSSSVPLETPLKPDAGPVYWLNYALRRSNGLALQIGANASLDQRLGNRWARLELPLDARQQWQLRGEYTGRLEDGWQALLALRRRSELAFGVIADAELALRQESVVGQYRFAETRLGLYREVGFGGFGINLQRATALDQGPPGGDQWRATLLWGGQWRLGKLQYSLAAMQRYSRDDETYHPLLAAARPRWQSASLLSLGLEYPLGQGLALWGRLALERQRSNVEFFTTRRSEGLLGLAYGW